MKLKNNKNITKLIKIYNTKNPKLLKKIEVKIIFKVHFHLYINKICIIFQLKL